MNSRLNYFLFNYSAHLQRLEVRRMWRSMRCWKENRHERMQLRNLPGRFPRKNCRLQVTNSVHWEPSLRIWKSDLRWKRQMYQVQHWGVLPVRMFVGFPRKRYLLRRRQLSFWLESFLTYFDDGICNNFRLFEHFLKTKIDEKIYCVGSK